MSRTETVLQVFVASPSDVSEERKILGEVISELNLTWARTLGVRLDLWGWESSGYPGAGTDPQDVINAEAPPDYDIFVGMMWARFGAPTPRAGSGTEEEFRNAKMRHDAAGGMPDVMFYFKNAPLAPASIDPVQLALVASFKASLGKEGLLYWSFDSVDQFRDLIRLHLARLVQAWLKRNKGEGPERLEKGVEPEPLASTIAAHATQSTPSEDDQGFLDLVETSTNAFGRLTEIGARMSESVSSLGARMTDRGLAMRALEKSDPTYWQSARRISGGVADDLDEFAARTNLESPLFIESFRTGMDALSRAAAVSLDFTSGSESLESALTAVSGLRASLRSSSAPVRGFRETLASIPRLTTAFNRSKRRAVEAVDRLLAAFDEGDAASEQAEDSIRALLPRPDGVS